MPIIVADDGRVPVDLPPHVTHLKLPFDVGISQGRNEALALIETPYFLLLDDDYIFASETDVSALRDPVARGEWEVVGGRWLQDGTYIRHNLLLERRGPYLLKIPGCRGVKGAISAHDIVTNFFVAKTEVIRDLGGWHPELKVGEHMMFFARCQAAGLRVGATDLATVTHAPTYHETYARFRGRGLEFLEEYGPTEHNLLGFYEHDGQFFDLAPEGPHPDRRNIDALSPPTSEMLGISFASASITLDRGAYGLHLEMDFDRLPEDAVCVVHAFGEEDLLPLDRREHGFYNLDFPIRHDCRSYTRQLHIPSGRYRFDVGVLSPAASSAEIATFGLIDLEH